MKLKQVGEFDLIGKMARIFSSEAARQVESDPTRPRLYIGIGDDAAVWEARSDQFSIATVDAMIEGVHFTRATTAWYDLGWKAMASNISDIAGMGARPAYALVALGAPADLDVEDALLICRGMADIAARFGVSVIGGDTVASPIAMISITLIGTSPYDSASPSEARLLSRSNAKPGDVIAVTGTLGGSAGGLDLLLNGKGSDGAAASSLIETHRRPMPRVKEGQLLVEAGVRCGMDLSDGLTGDLRRICEASGVSATIDLGAVPIDPSLSDIFGDRADVLALSGGEDYELLCSAPPEVIERARGMLSGAGTILTPVGAITSPVKGMPAVLVRDRQGHVSAPSRSGWEHFSSGSDVAAS